MAKDRTNSGPVPSLSGGSMPPTPTKAPGDFDKFVAANIDKAVIGTPTDDGGVTPIVAGSPPAAGTIELPAGLSNEQRAQIEGVIQARSSQAAAAAVRHAVATPPPSGDPRANPQTPQPIASQPFATDRGAPRAWNPMDQIAPTTPMSVLENALQSNMGLATAPTTGMGGALQESKPLPETPQVYVEAYNLLRALIAGNWILPGGKTAEVNGLLPRMKVEIEQGPNSVNKGK